MKLYKSVSLDPGQSKEVSFTFTPGEVRSYQVSVDGLIGSFSAMVPPPSIDIIGFHYVYQATYTWSLVDRMIHGSDVTHIGFKFRNNGATGIPGVSVRMRVVDMETAQGYPRPDEELGPPLNQYLSAISQPFVAPPGNTQVWYGFTCVTNYTLIHATAIAEVLINGELVATACLEFNVLYD